MDNISRVIFTPFFSKDFSLEIKVKIHQPQPFGEKLFIKPSIHWDEKNNKRAILQLGTIYRWIDMWDVMVTEAKVHNSYNMEISNPDFFRINPPNEDFIYPFTLMIDDLREQVKKESQSLPVGFDIKPYSEGEILELINEAFYPRI